MTACIPTKTIVSLLLFGLVTFVAPANAQNEQIDFTSFPAVGTVDESKNGVSVRANVVTTYNACRQKDLADLWGDGEDFTTVAIARLELAHQHNGCPPSPATPAGVSASKLIEGVGDALWAQQLTDHKLGTACFGKGDAIFAVRGLITMLYRYSSELHQKGYSTPNGLSTAYDHVMNDLLKPMIAGPPDLMLKDLNYECGPIHLPETENHVLMISTSRYLANQLLQWDNKISGFDDYAR